MKTDQCVRENWSAKENFYRLRYVCCGTAELRQVLYHMAIVVFTPFSKRSYSNNSSVQSAGQCKLENGDPKQVYYLDEYHFTHSFPDSILSELCSVTRLSDHPGTTSLMCNKEGFQLTSMTLFSPLPGF